MSDSKAPAKNGQSALVKVLYVIAALLAVIFVYMVIVNITYMNAYLASYRMTFSDMWMDTVQYVIDGSISYLVYAILIFSIGRIIGMLSAKGAPEATAEERETSDPDAAPAIPAAGGRKEVGGLKSRSRMRRPME